MVVARGLRADFGKAHVLAGCDLVVGAGESVAVRGPSGSGKSTLLNALAGLVPSSADELVVCGMDVSRSTSAKLDDLRLRRIGYVLQDGALFEELSLTANVALPLRLQGVDRSEADGRAEEWLGALGLIEETVRLPGECSGGERQRAAVARAFVHGPSLVLADEPTGALDRRTSELVVDSMVEQQRRSGAAMVVVTHDDAVAERMDRIVDLFSGVLTARSESAG